MERKSLQSSPPSVRKLLFLVFWKDRYRTKPGVLCGLPVAYLLFCKDTFITLAFEGIRTSYLIHIGLLAMAIYGITHCYGNLVTMATEACVCNFAV